MTLCPDYAERIAVFREKYQALRDYANEVLEDGIKVSVPWKMHILGLHVEQWLDKHPTGLGVYAEQTGEAAHKDFLKTWKRFKVRESHRTHAEKLKRAVVHYSSKRLK